MLMVAQPEDGGVHKHVLEVATGLAERGWDVVVAGPRSYNKLGPAVAYVPIEMVREIAPLQDASAARRLGRIARHLRPSLIHLHSAKAGALGRALKPFVGSCPIVYSPHGYAHAGYFTSSVDRRFYRAAELALGPATRCVLCACEAEREIATGVISRRRTRVAYNGVDLLSAGPSHGLATAAAVRGPVLSLVAGLRAGKGVESAIQALAVVHRRHPAAQLVIAGDGPLRPELERLARDLGVGDDTHLIGLVQDPGTVLRAATVHVSASWAESFPFAVLEGLAAGLPVVATDVGGTREAIEHDVTGLLVPARDPMPLGAAIAGLLDDATIQRRLGAAGRDRVASSFTVTQMVDAVESTYVELIGRS